MKHLVFVALLALPLAALDIHVATNGNDAAAGTSANPLRSLEKARDLARQAKGVPVNVLLHAGTWYLDRPLAFSAEDGGSENTPRIWSSAPGKRATLVGGRPVTGWKKTGKGVYTASVGKGWTFHQLMENDTLARKARHPNEDYLHVAEGIPVRDKNGELIKHKQWGTATSKREFIYTQGDLPEGAFANAEVYLWAGFDWFAGLFPISNIDRGSRRISLARETLVPIVIRPERRYFLQGFREALDAPGEFWLDREAGELHYRPMKEPIEAQRIVASTVNRILDVRGASPAEPVRHLRFSGIDFALSEFTDSFMETLGTHGTGVWNEPMNKDAALYFENTAFCAVERCRIVGAGYSAVAFVWGAFSNRVTGCEIAQAGFHGVLLSGYRANFGVNADSNRGHLIDDNWIHHVGRNVGHGASVFVWASGNNRITHNVMHDSPRYAVCIKGEGPEEATPAKYHGNLVRYRERYPYIHSRNNLIADNDMFRISQDTEDNGFVSFWNCGSNNRVVQNLMHDSRRKLGGLGMAVYLDDGSDFCALAKNVVWGIEGGDRLFGFFNKGQFNVTENNVVVVGSNAMAAVRMWEGFGRSAQQHRYRNNIFVTAGKASCFSFEFAGWELPRLSAMDQNLYWNPQDHYEMKGSMAGGDITLDDWMAQSGYDKASLIADPLFVDAARGDYRLAANSPAWKLGFEKIEMEQIGLRTGNPMREAQRAMQKALGCLPDYSGNPALTKTSAAPAHQAKTSFDQPTPRWFRESGLSNVFRMGGLKTYVEAPTSIDAVPSALAFGKSALVFRDAPGPKYDPRIMVNTVKSNGKLTLRGVFRQDPEKPAAFTFEPRQLSSAKGAYASGTVLIVSRSGSVMADDREIARVAPGTWFEIALVFALGSPQETWSATVKAEGKLLASLELPKKDREFRVLERLLLFGHEQVEGAFQVGELDVILD
jgi:hypothetical protein